MGHISRAYKCKQANRKQHTNPKNTNYLSEERGESTDAQHVESPYSMFTFENKHSASYKITVSVNDTPVEMEIDIGAAFSVISKDTYKHLCSQSKLPPPPPLKDTGVVLRTYTGEAVKPNGNFDVTVCYEGKQFQLPLLVVVGNGLVKSS